jgi:hypothetical protein
MFDGPGVCGALGVAAAVLGGGDAGLGAGGATLDGANVTLDVAGVTLDGAGATLDVGGVALGVDVGVGATLSAGLSMALTAATEGAVGSGVACHSQTMTTVASAPSTDAPSAICRAGHTGATGVGARSRRTSIAGVLRCSAAFFSASRM